MSSPNNNLILVIGKIAPPCESLIALLRKNGHEILIASNYADALQKITPAPDLLIDFYSKTSETTAFLDSLNLDKNLQTTPILFVTSEARRLRAELDETVAPDFDALELALRVARLLERKRMSEKFRETEKRFNTLIENVSDILTIFRSDGTVLYQSPAITRILGYLPEEIFGQNAFDFIHQDDLRRVLKKLELTFQTNAEEWFIEYRFRHKNGSWVWLESNGRRFLDPQQGDVGLAVSRDITKRKQAEEDLSSERTLTDDALNSLPGIFYLYNREGRFLRWNENFERVSGYSSEEISVMQPLDFFRDDEKAAVSKEIDEVFNTGESSVEADFLSKDGRSTPHYFTGKRVFIRGDLYLVGMGIDISESREAKEALSRSEEHFRSLIENSTDIINLLDAEGNFLYENPSIERQLGYAPDEVIGTNVFELIHPDDSVFFKDAFSKILTKDGKVLTVRFRIRHKDSSWRYFESTAKNLLHNPAVKAIVVNSRDVTAETLAQEKLRESEERYRSIVENANDIIFTLDLAGFYTSINRAAEIVTGYTREEALGMKFTDLIAPEHLDVVVQKFQNKIGGSDATIYEKEIITKNNRRLMLEVNSHPIVKNGELVGVLGIARDITERKHAEWARLESENRFRAIFYNASIGIAIGDVGLRPIESNLAYQQMLGYSSEELREMTIADFLHPEDAAREISLHKDLIAGKYDHFREEKRYIRKDGRVIWGNSTVSLVRDESGAPLFSVTMLEDITERKRTEDELRRSEERFRAIIDNTPNIAIEGYDRDGRVVFWNCAAEQLFGFSEKEALGKTLDQLILDEEGHAQFVESLREMEITGEPVGPTEWEFVRKDGKSGALYSTTFPISAQDDRKIFVCIDIDISERKRIEESLRESEERYRDLVENANDIIYTHDLQGNYTSINKAGERITGYSLGEVLKMKISDAVAPEHLETAMQSFRDKLDGIAQAAYEIEIIIKDGSRLPIEVNTRLIYENGVPVGVQGIARDITVRKNLEEQLRQAQKLEAVGRLAGGIAHDFNNMLTVITSYSDLLLRRVDLDGAVRSKIEEIRRAGERSASLTQQLLAFSRRQIMQLQIIDLNRVVEDMGNMLQRVIGEDIHLITTLNPKIGLVKADVGQITQVVMNLAVNARDAMPKGGKLIIETENVLLEDAGASGDFLRETEHYVLLKVTDTGMGMDAETQQHIFEPFFTTKEVGKGTGLGLSTVYGIVKQSGGFIEVESELERGTSFLIYLPRIEEKVAPGAVAEDQAPPRKARILLVEDETMVRNLTREVLEMYGFEVLEAPNGVEALDVFKQSGEKIDLLMTDVVMPQMSGRELAERLTELDDGIAVLYTSGYTREAIGNHGVLDEDTNFIQKPFSPDTLISKIKNVLGES